MVKKGFFLPYLTNSYRHQQKNWKTDAALLLSQCYCFLSSNRLIKTTTTKKDKRVWVRRWGEVGVQNLAYNPLGIWIRHSMFWLQRSGLKNPNSKLQTWCSYCIRIIKEVFILASEHFKTLLIRLRKIYASQKKVILHYISDSKFKKKSRK